MCWYNFPAWLNSSDKPLQHIIQSFVGLRFGYRSPSSIIRWFELIDWSFSFINFQHDAIVSIRPDILFIPCFPVLIPFLSLLPPCTHVLLNLSEFRIAYVRYRSHLLLNGPLLNRGKCSGWCLEISFKGDWSSSSLQRILDLYFYFGVTHADTVALPEHGQSRLMPQASLYCLCSFPFLTTSPLQ